MIIPTVRCRRMSVALALAFDTAVAPQAVHEGPIDQSWGTRAFHVDDPDGNTLRFTEGF